MRRDIRALNCRHKGGMGGEVPLGKNKKKTNLKQFRSTRILYCGKKLIRTRFRMSPGGREAAQLGVERLGGKRAFEGKREEGLVDLGQWRREPRLKRGFKEEAFAGLQFR